MGIERIFKSTRPEAAPSAELKSEIKKWKEASFDGPICLRGEYAILLSLRSDSSKKVYASLVVYPSRVNIDIPVMDNTPQEELIKSAYDTTFFGEVDPEKYREFATGPNRRSLLAFLNRTKAGVTSNETPQWFYATFGLKSQGPYDSVYIGSSGGIGNYGYESSITIGGSSETDDIAGNEEISAIAFAQMTQKSLLNIIVTPLSIDRYLEDIQSTLKFLPKDWE